MIDYSLLFALGLGVFLVVFLKTEIGLYLVVFSMLLSPEFGGGGGATAGGHEVVIRSEDVLLLIVTLSWFAKTAVNKEIGLVATTPLNRPIMAYVTVTALATLVGYALGTVKSLGGFFFVLKYLEYFFVYYMVVNNLDDRDQAWRLVTAAFLTAAIVSLVGMAQIPSGQRVSAPFEGKEGEPNTFGGYLLLMMALAGGVALETTSLRTRTVMLGLLGLMAPPFVFTLSRASYLAVVPTLLVFALFSSRRKLIVGVLVLLLVASPLAAGLLPKSVVRRILYTFEPEAGQATVKVGRVAFDPSTSARFISIKQGLVGWTQRPLLGYGVTGFGFMDSQYFRTLVETGIIGLAAFLWLVRSLLQWGLNSFRALRHPEDRGLALGFVAGTIGLLVHAIGSNTFIIVRIMEPFWFFAGIVMMLPQLKQEAPVPTAARPVLARPRRVGV